MELIDSDVKKDIKKSVEIIEDLLDDLKYYAEKSSHLDKINNNASNFIRTMREKYGISII